MIFNRQKANEIKRKIEALPHYNFNIGGLNVHQGSLFGLPDIGATEKLSDFFGQEELI